MGQSQSRTKVNKFTIIIAKKADKLAAENKQLKIIINEIQKQIPKKPIPTIIAIPDSYSNTTKKNMVYDSIIDSEFERPIPNDIEKLKIELQQFSDFISNNIDTILAANSVMDDKYIMLAQLVNLAGLEYARKHIFAKKNE